MAIIFGLKHNGTLWNQCWWVSHTNQVPQNFFDNLNSNSWFDDIAEKEFLETELFTKELDEVESAKYQHLEWYG